MKIGLECVPCFINQSIEAVKMVSDDKELHTKIIKEVIKHLGTIKFDDYSPPELSKEVHEIIRSLTKSNDPYKNVKNQSNKMAEKYYYHLKNIVQNADDSLLMAIKLSIVGNVIDFGTSNRFNVEDMIENALKKDFDDEAYPRFKEVLNKSKSILYLADNSGEIFFDKLLIEELIKNNTKINYVVKANPIINDATVEDGFYAGIDKLTRIIEGDAGQKSSAPGISLSFTSDELLKLFKSSDMIISKGQGNYESLSNCTREIFFLLMIKCPLVAKDVGIDMGKFVLKVKNSNNMR